MILPPHSRFRETQVVNLDGIDMLAEWKRPTYGRVGERLYVVTESDLDRPDIISHRMYGSVFYWWLILDYNFITDPWTLQVGDRLIIPQWTWSDSSTVTPSRVPPEVLPQLPPPLPVRYSPPSYKRPRQLQAADSVQAESRVVFNLAIQVPECLTGIAHFEIQVSPDSNFDNVSISRFTATSNDRWYFYDHLLNSGAGGHARFPGTGLDVETYAGAPVYFRVLAKDGLVSGEEYFVRFRVVIDDQNSQWQGLPPIISPAD